MSLLKNKIVKIKELGLSFYFTILLEKSGINVS